MGRSYRVSTDGLEKAKAAIKLKGWTQEYLAGAAGCSRPVISKFFGRGSVEMRLFQIICTELSLEWGDIADLESESEQLSKTDKDKIIPEPSGTTQVLTDKKSYAFAIAGTVSPEDIAKLKAIAALLKDLAQDTSIKIIDIESGSIKLILEGSQEGLERLETLFKSGQLEDVLGVSVEDVEFVDVNNSNSDQQRLEFTIAGDVAESEIAKLKAVFTETSDDRVQRFQSQRLASGGNPLRVNLVFANLIRGNLGGAFRILKNLIRADLIRADLHFTYLKRAYLRNANLSDANLSHANLSDVNLSHANLSDANLSHANLSHANLSHANFSRAHLEGANLSHADLESANLSGMYVRTVIRDGETVTDADFRSANIRNANLSYANLRNANLRNADLEGANLSGANLSGAKFMDAIVTNALFGGAIGLEEEMKRDLEKRGAIFGDRPPVLNPK